MCCGVTPPPPPEPRGASVHTRQKQQSKDDLFGLIYIAVPAAGGRWCTATEETARGVTLPLSHGRKAAFLSLFVRLCVCRCDYVKLPGGRGTLGAVTSP